MLFTDVIRKKRDGGKLSGEEIGFFVAGLADGSLPAEQVSALAMAIFLNSMDAEEAGALTAAMTASGVVLKWNRAVLGGPAVDKHSTGGVGDKASFMLAPILAACGCFVPMVSGRGLGHSGGTLDKIESIPGYNATPDLETFRKVVHEVGCAIIGQTAEMAPADRRLYAIRDITGTVESIPLITASILSKKIAAGNEALVLDVKTGSGAFMESLADARDLARSIIATGAAVGLKVHALITDMAQVLGETAGNALEMAESVDYLLGRRREPRLDDVTLALAAEMLVMTGLAEDRDAARGQADKAVTSGRAAEVFGRMVAALGGPADFLERSEDYLPVAPLMAPVVPAEPGYLTAVNARAIGNAVIALGGGRRRQDDVLDLAVGFSNVAPVGTFVGPERPLAIAHASSEDDLQRALENYCAACRVGSASPPAAPAILETLTAP